MLRILLAEDDPDARAMLSLHLRRGGFQVIEASGGRAAIELATDDLSVAMFDLRMPGGDGIECLIACRRRCPDVPVIMVSGEGDLSDGVRAMRLGAFDYIAKPYDPDELLARVREAVELREARRENRGLRAAIASAGPPALPVAHSPVGRRLAELASRAAGVDAPVLVTGPSGTGKTRLARHIHQSGPRRRGPFVTVSCGALPRDLIEFELFGHVRGAFTGADAARFGRVEMANNGTLFLDEIAELPFDLQRKLLNVLQDRMISRLGSEDTQRVDFRLIAATNRDLEAAVEDGAFREDLLFRLDVIRIEMPSLTERQEDIVPLATRFIEAAAARLARPAPELATDARLELLQHGWPGNIRELENAIERAMVLADGPVIEARHLALKKRRRPASADTPAQHTALTSDQAATDPARPAPPDAVRIPPATQSEHASVASLAEGSASPTLAEIERQAILDALEAEGGNRARAARRLGISERTIYNKLRHFNG